MANYRSNAKGYHAIDIRTHKAAKQHECCSCKKTVQSGEEYTKTVCTEGGIFYSNAWHTSCFHVHAGYIDDLRRKE
jgi:predicted RNA-binding Zn-ribbon protein involved in translation (DUF1610 family)